MFQCIQSMLDVGSPAAVQFFQPSHLFHGSFLSYLEREYS